MNIINTEPGVIAGGVKLRLIRSKSTLAVYADECGDVFFDRAHDPRRKVEPPAEFLAGVYTAGVAVELIADDLASRRDELLASGAHPVEPPRSCRECGEVKPISRFFVRVPGKRHDTTCKECRGKQRRARESMARPA